MKLIILGKDDLDKLLTTRELMESMRNAFIDLVEGRSIVPQRSVFSLMNEWWGVMPSLSDFFVTKIVNVIPRNREKSIPATNGLVILFSRENGLPMAIIDGTTLTAMRTAATSLLTVELIRGKVLGKVGFIGSGLQAIYHLRMMTEEFKVEEILAIERRGTEKLREIANEKGIKFSVVHPHELLKESEVIFALTTSKTPVVLGSYLHNSHVVSIGVVTKDSRELDDEAIRRANLVIVDNLKACLEETGDINQTYGKILSKEKVIELGYALKEGVNTSGITIFKSVGNPIQDNYASKLAFLKAKERGAGKEIEL
jgi:alanine dehydrogenase